MNSEPEWLRIRRSVTWGNPDAWDRFAMLWCEVAWRSVVTGYPEVVLRRLATHIDSCLRNEP